MRNGSLPPRILNVAEKNDAAKSISRVLTNNQFSNREGGSRFNRVYEFQLHHTSLGGLVHMLFTSVCGHLMNVEFADSHHRNWQTCRPSELFDAPVARSVPDNMLPIKRCLEKEVRTAAELVIWTDCDREGENIGFEVIAVCRAIKPNIPIKRAKFSEITPTAIQRALANLQAPDERQSDAVEARRELDLRIGAAFTRFQTLRLQRAFPALSSQVISFGPCQFPTLGFVVDRWREREQFVQEPFWKLKMVHRTATGDTEFTWGRVRLFDEDIVAVMADECREVKEATVTKVDHKHKSKWRPVALDTIELEKAASRKLRITARETMNIAEKLYNAGYISYPRTETNKFPQGLDLGRLVEAQVPDSRWGPFAQRVLADGGPNPRNGSKTDQAHPPIHPIKHSNTLSGNEGKIYEFIVRHFLACLSKDAVGKECKVEAQMGEETFHTSGLVIIERNYLDVYIYDVWSNKYLPEYQLGQKFTPHSIDVVESQTSPPSLLTEADLIALMDKHGIGTDATHAEHIEKIKNREYSAVVDGRFHPAELGIGLVEGYEEIGRSMSKPDLRAEMETDFAQICSGAKTRQQVLAHQINKYRAAFRDLETGALKMDEALAKYFGRPAVFAPSNPDQPHSPPVFKCPRCGKNMVLSSFASGQLSKWKICCEGYPSCKNTIWIPDFVTSVSVSATSCSRCSNNQNGDNQQLPKLLEFAFKPNSVPPFFGREYSGCLAGCNNDLLELIRVNSGSAGNNSSSNTSTPSQYQQTIPGWAYEANSSSSSRNSRVANTRGMGSGTPLRGTSRPSAVVRPSMEVTPTFRNPPQSRPSLAQVRPSLAQVRPSPTQARPSLAQVRPSPAQARPSLPQTRPNLARMSDHGLYLGGNQNDQGNSVQTVCACGEPASLLTVRKEGPNQGRNFFKCAQSKCTFFLWKDDPNSSAPASGRGADPGGIVCQCGHAASLKTVSKEGPNRGRQFYTCAHPPNEHYRCKFFLWTDEAASEPGASAPRTAAVAPSRDGGAGAGDGPTCNCGNASVTRTVSRDGPNKGRRFFTCAEPPESGCGFFSWCDADSSTPSGSASAARKRRAGPSASQPRNSRRGRNS